MTNSSTGAKFYVNIVSGKTQKDFPTVPSLPPGWEVATGASGKVYYVNADTGQISQTAPTSADNGSSTSGVLDEQGLIDGELIMQHAAAIRIQALRRGVQARKAILAHYEELATEEKEVLIATLAFISARDHAFGTLLVSSVVLIFSRSCPLLHRQKKDEEGRIGWQTPRKQSRHLSSWLAALQVLVLAPRRARNRSNRERWVYINMHQNQQNARLARSYLI
eukprot:SAG31_NODE_1078_length_10032_cov_4.602034_5_plen_222_part_00